MATDAERSKVTVEELVARCRGELIPLSSRFSYFSTVPFADEDLRQYLNDPISAISPKIAAAVPKTGIVLAPYLEKGNGKGDWIAFERPSESKQIACSRTTAGDMAILALGLKEVEVADFHYRFYNALSSLVADRWPV